MNVMWLTLPIKGPLSSVTVGDYFSSKVAQLFGDCKGYPFEITYLVIFGNICSNWATFYSHKGSQCLSKRKLFYFTETFIKTFKLLEPQTFIGRASEQVDEFIVEEVDPVLGKYPKKSLEGKVELKL